MLDHPHIHLPPYFPLYGKLVILAMKTCISIDYSTTSCAESLSVIRPQYGLVHLQDVNGYVTRKMSFTCADPLFHCVYFCLVYKDNFTHRFTCFVKNLRRNLIRVTVNKTKYDKKWNRPQ